MVKISIFYPYKKEARFDHEYYARKHIPFLRQKLEPFGMIRVEIDKGLPGAKGEAPLFVAACHLFFGSMSQFQQGIGAVGGELSADVPNYTDIVPQVQFSEMVE